MKYKLVKKYPGSPNIGDTAELDIKLGDFRVSSNYFQLIPKKQIINYPEFWEEIKEPLFVTEDGVEIQIGDKLHYLNKINGVRGEYYWGNSGQFPHKEYFQGSRNKDIFYWFASKEKLEIFWDNLQGNKPRFSVKDIEEALLFAKEEKHSVIEDEGFIILSKFNEKKFKQKLGI